LPETYKRRSLTRPVQEAQAVQQSHEANQPPI
jgi:hypothetical protein